MHISDTRQRFMMEGNDHTDALVGNNKAIQAAVLMREEWPIEGARAC